ncbi:Ras GTPase-activating-like protein IQGAP2 [Oopsacas minuta]|uniref:Ras GTPase-activating-like protein IQGAP2 n=1 Tax=Oopsacas minuta TaxID=111878 RepID=A0AAV7KJU7_9METZ|nr:Ras GTPase-activating-like protein IQGAP2 [Oopsacas minuta]
MRNRLQEAIEIVKNSADEFMDAIFSNVNNPAYGLRYMAYKLKEFLENKFPSGDREDISKVIGNLVYYRFLNPAIATPDAFEIVELEAGESLENDYGRFMEFFQSADVCTAEEKFGITEYSDIVVLSRMVIISTHELLLAHLNAITEDNDPLREVLKELGIYETSWEI